ncbi:YgiQ family radical SAM protein [Chloroflexota bacterium]
MFLPTTPEEIKRSGWDRLDIILVTGDSYIDSPYIGVAVVGKLLTRAGYRVGVIAQPDITLAIDITRLGEPRLFWGVTAGSTDSLVANYTSLKKPRRTDDYTPGGINNRRPDRATIAYTNLIRRNFKPTRPIVLGGIEASLRRIAHYDFWTNRVRRSILFDSKADYLLYGMAEKSVLALAEALESGQDVRQIRGLCYIAGNLGEIPERGKYLELPAYEAVHEDKEVFTSMFHTFYQNNDPLTARGLYQAHGPRYLVQNPPAPSLTPVEMDDIYSLDYERAQHPYYEAQGQVQALETIRFAIPTHRGCYGECNFCAISVHEGRTVQWRSPQSILAEAGAIVAHPEFKGYILDVGGPTANMYGFECRKKLEAGACRDKHCLFPAICPSLKPSHRTYLEVLEKIRRIPGVKKVFVASGIRYDLLFADEKYGEKYLEALVAHHVSGQLKIAPEHTERHVLDIMGKPGREPLRRFKKQFDEQNRKTGLKQFLTYYLMAAHPGCTLKDMETLNKFAGTELKTWPEQVQIFLPAPSTYSTLMYYREADLFTGKPLFVEKDTAGKESQKAAVLKPKTRETSHKRLGMRGRAKPWPKAL